ncbi:MAG: polyribonucleotide nucleotidyltransferase [Alphaproteobacteria bacterium]|nr:polyribonucleotide nucleotidyltransferase [Alphaproteobacteria bacterium]MDD9919602.1 polyribonucleotide nucleotidyltransferase [Alphaproteobacteria bacterium]
MFTIYKKQIEWGGRELTLETGRMARQADGAVLATYGGTQVLATVCYARQPKEGVDFFPLTCLYQEKFYASGRIPGSFFRREGRPSEKETLTSRLMDRPIRPLFVKGFQNETQVVATVLSADSENDPDVVAMVAASAALTISGAPFLGPISAARVGYVDGEYTLNPTNEEREASNLDLVVAGTKEGVLMVESEAKELSEDVMLGAVNYGHEQCQKVIDAIIELAEKAAKPGFEMPEAEDYSALQADLEKAYGSDIVAAFKIADKIERQNRMEELTATAVEAQAGSGDEQDGEKADLVKKLMKGLRSDVMRKDVLTNKKRIDGRTPVDVRPIVCEVDTLSRTHGSALFTRGETQALVVTTLGTKTEAALMDTLDGTYDETFMLHYNFPPYSVGEVGRMGSPGRREIGHGKLAYRAIRPLMPNADACPYTIRVVSEITESNGSSSMATVCGTSMSLMAAGVALPKPIAGIAMGLVKENDDFVVLSDIMGDEDHLGDMDFKVAGSAEGITALQMDIKITSITKEIMEIALNQAKDGRLHILDKMATAITEARTDISEYAPAMKNMMVPVDKIREVIGKGGDTIRALCEQFDVTINIEDDGTTVVAGVNRTSVDDCIAHITQMVADPEVGTIYSGKVTGVTDFGAFVEIMPGKEGLLHISEVVPVRLGHITDVMGEGDAVTVRVVEFENGKTRLTAKEIDQEGSVADKMEEVIAAGGTSRPEGDKEGGDRKKRGDRGPRRRRD